MQSDFWKIRQTARPLAVVTSIFALLVFSIHFFLLPVAVSAGTHDFWLVLLPVCMLCCGLTVILAQFVNNNRFLSGLTTIFTLLTFLLALLLITILIRGVWYSQIGPRAEVILPDEYSGDIEILILKQIEPSLKTSGKVFQYIIPKSGYLLVKNGWINVRHTFSDEYSVSEKYYTHFQRKNGTPLHQDEFKCHWLYEGGIRCTIGKE